MCYGKEKFKICSTAVYSISLLPLCLKRSFEIQSRYKIFLGILFENKYLKLQTSLTFSLERTSSISKHDISYIFFVIRCLGSGFGSIRSGSNSETSTLAFLTLYCLCCRRAVQPSWALSVAGCTGFSPTLTSITGQFPPAVFWIRHRFRLVVIGSSIVLRATPLTM